VRKTSELKEAPADSASEPARDEESIEEMGPEVADPTPSQHHAETEGFARLIAVAGLQVSQAADELQHAARRLMEAEEDARDAELRWRAAEDELAQGASKHAELLAMLQSTRDGQAEGEERARRAEQRLQIALDRARIMEEQIQALEARTTEAEEQPHVTVIVDDERTALQEAVAADVRRPLTSILGLTLALKHADPQSVEGADMVKQLATNARKLDRLVGEMLALDKIANGTYEPNLRRTDVEALVRRVVEESPDLANRDVKVEAEHIALEVDPALTEQMVETLLSNAGRRTAPGNVVWVKISSDQGGAVIAVDDTGPEVPPGLRGAMVAALSDEGPAARHRPRGGTGLTLLARLAEIHGGRAWVEEHPGGGASFRVFLPGTQEPQQESVDDRAAARVLDPDDERAIALAKALVGSGEDGDDGLFDADAISAELREIGGGLDGSLQEVRDDEIVL
jgi:K+-sensing histidine kinase KdpD